ncbi:uncharacterized protein LOC143894216 [Temnothorax americanus]|uniref:uncharacterized protein LOC143894216 n=1 Tax=Temnothorax americanus TaxID=1964332 RepID=UPI004067E8AC
MGVMIRNILKKMLTNPLAQQFSRAGRKNKHSFKNLKLANIITQAVRTVHRQITDAEIANSISKWLSQGTLRFQRESCSKKKHSATQRKSTSK